MSEVTVSDNHHEPSVQDVLLIKDVLSKRSKLPLKIVDSIIDIAEYWPHSFTGRQGTVKIYGGKSSDRAERGLFPATHTKESQMILRTYPLGYSPCGPNASSLSESECKSYLTTDAERATNFGGLFYKASEETETSHSQLAKEFPCRKIVFTIRSHDQGWGGESSHRGTYNGSYTWFDVDQERPVALRVPPDTSPSQKPDISNETIPERKEELPTSDLGDPSHSPQLVFLPEVVSAKRNASLTSYTLRRPTSFTISNSPHESGIYPNELLPSPKCLQQNLTAIRALQTNIITWRYDDAVDSNSEAAQRLIEQGRGPASMTGEYVRNMRIGDVVTVWAKARFPGWINTVVEVGIDIYWAV